MSQFINFAFVALKENWFKIKHIFLIPVSSDVTTQQHLRSTYSKH